MEREEIEKIRTLTKDTLGGISRLRNEIKNYKTGAEGFLSATESLEKIYLEQRKLTRELGELIKKLRELDFRIETKEEEEKETRREIREAKREILEKLEEISEEKKRGRFRLFKRG